MLLICKPSSGRQWWLKLGHGAMHLLVSCQCRQLIKLFQQTQKEVNFLWWLRSQTDAAPLYQLILAMKLQKCRTFQARWYVSACIFLFSYTEVAFEHSCWVWPLLVKLLVNLIHFPWWYTLIAGSRPCVLRTVAMVSNGKCVRCWWPVYALCSYSLYTELVHLQFVLLWC